MHMVATYLYGKEYEFALPPLSLLCLCLPCLKLKRGTPESWTQEVVHDHLMFVLLYRNPSIQP